MNWLFSLLILIALITGSPGLGFGAIVACILWNCFAGIYRYIRYGET